MTTLKSSQCYLSLFDEPLFGERSCVVVIGNFDGLHLGHQALIKRAHAHAARLSAEAKVEVCALTFHPHPAQFFARLSAEHAQGRDDTSAGQLGPKSIYNLDDKRALFERYGVSGVLFQRFDERFASLSPLAFVEEVLLKALKARVVVVGYDFAFGAKRAGRAADLKRLCAERGVEVEIIEAQTERLVETTPLERAQHTGGERTGAERIGGEQTRAYSSSWARALIEAGELERASQLLSRPYHVRGVVARGYQRGRQLGFPTANLALESELCPPPGVYAGWLSWGEGPQPAVLSIGQNPTFSEPHRLTHQQPWSVEVHVIRAHEAPPLNLYDRAVVLWPLLKIRDMRAFEGLEALKAQISLDRAEAVRRLQALPPPQWPA